MARIPQALKTKCSKTALAEDSADAVEVAKVAYGLYELRGMENGHDIEDWIQAEKIVRARANMRAPKPSAP